MLTTRAEKLKHLRNILNDIYNSGQYTSHTQRQLNACTALIGQLEAEEINYKQIAIDSFKAVMKESLEDQVMRLNAEMDANERGNVTMPEEVRIETDERDAFNEKLNNHFNER